MTLSVLLGVATASDPTPQPTLPDDVCGVWTYYSDIFTIEDNGDVYLRRTASIRNRETGVRAVPVYADARGKKHGELRRLDDNHYELEFEEYYSTTRAEKIGNTLQFAFCNWTKA